MNCAWQAYISLLPHWMRQDVDMHGKESLEELRLRSGMPVELRLHDRSIFLSKTATVNDLNYCINIASNYSAWSAQTIAFGYITAQGGHRIGICGAATVENDRMKGISHPTSVCIRAARDYSGIAAHADTISGSILIIGKPGIGKTTLLRDLIRRRSNLGVGSISVVDEKCEIFPKVDNDFCFPIGNRTDVLSGCSKPQGILAVLRNMGPEYIAVDEITDQSDCDAMLQAGWCGVKLLATAHAANMEDLYTRPVYRPIIENKLFQTVIVLRTDKSWYAERIDQ